MRVSRFIAGCLLVPLVMAASAASAAAVPTFADLADLVVAAPVIVRAEVSKAQNLSVAEAGAAAPGQQRQLMTARVLAALRAPDSVPPEISYLWDAPTDDRGRAAKLKGAAVLLFLRPAPARPDQLQLVGARAQLPWRAETEAEVRGLVAASAKGDVPVVTGVVSAFRVAGAVPGEAESQFFLATQSGKPVSLVLLTRPGQPQSLSIALGDVIDDAARAVQPDTLLWYRLACFLPAVLPEAAASGDDRAVADDYLAALALIGACARSAPH